MVGEIVKNKRHGQTGYLLSPPKTIIAIPRSCPCFQICVKRTDIPNIRKNKPPMKNRNATIVVFGGGYRTIFGARCLGVRNSVSPLPICMLSMSPNFFLELITTVKQTFTQTTSNTVTAATHFFQLRWVNKKGLFRLHFVASKRRLFCMQHSKL